MMEVAASADASPLKKIGIRNGGCREEEGFITMTFKEARERFHVQGIDNAYLDTNAAEQDMAFNNCIRLLEGVAKTKTIRRQHSSYGLKHYAEDPAKMFPSAYADLNTYTGYVHESTLILAALSLGFACEYRGQKSMNCFFNISETSLRTKVKQLLEEAKKTANGQ